MTETLASPNRTRAGEESEERFVRYLQNITEREDRAGLARLRRSLVNENHDFGAYAVLGPVLPDQAPDWKIAAYILVAGLFAMHPLPSPGRSTLGGSLRVLRATLANGEQSLDLVVTALLNAHTDDLPVRLRHAASRLASAGIPIDYRSLLRDVLRWNSVNGHIQRSWARDYWVHPEADAGRDTDTTDIRESDADGGDLDISAT